MDHGERIAEVEAKGEAHDQRFERIEHGLDRLQDELGKLGEHTDRGFAELRHSIDALCREQAITNRWLIGIAVTYGTAILGTVAKLAGMY